MVISFCGHSTYTETKENQMQILKILEFEIGNTASEFFLGEYGAFDYFAYKCATLYKKSHPNIQLIFVTPYIKSKKNFINQINRFDSIIFPPLEHVPKRYAISHRNKWIVDKSDIIIAYIDHNYGGAYQMYQYAQKTNKKIYNLAT